jgi:hypothetical protein
MAESRAEGFEGFVDQFFDIARDLGIDVDDSILFQKARVVADDYIRRIKRDEEVERLLTEESVIGLDKMVRIVGLYTQTFIQKGTGATCTVPAFEVEDARNG